MRAWNKADNKESLRQGWGIFDDESGNALEICKYDEMDRFQSDYQAMDYVMKRARKSGLCRRAIKKVYGF